MQNLGTLGLIDTGASISCISPELLAKLNIGSDLVSLSNSVSSVKGANNRHLNILGDVTLCVQIMENQFIHSFSILEDLIVPILLGLDFLNEYKFKLDFANNKLSFGDEEEISIINNSESKPQVNFAKLSTSVILPPYSFIII